MSEDGDIHGCQHLLEEVLELKEAALLFDAPPVVPENSKRYHFIHQATATHA